MRHCVLNQAHSGPHLFVETKSNFEPLLGDCLMYEEMNSIETKDDKGGKVYICIHAGYVTIYKNTRRVAGFHIGPMIVKEIKKALDAHVLPLTEEVERERRGI